MIANRSKRRRRRAPAHFHHTLPSSDPVSRHLLAEERIFQQALQNSKLDTMVGGVLAIPHAPVFFPTIEDFEGNPIQYVEKIRPVAEKYGIVKIVPPKGWNPRSSFGKSLQSLASYPVLCY